MPVAELAERQVAKLGVPPHGEIRAVDLQDDARRRDRLIFVAQPSASAKR